MAPAGTLPVPVLLWAALPGMTLPVAAEVRVPALPWVGRTEAVLPLVLSATLLEEQPPGLEG